jgi:hypothetical protein
MPGTVRRADGAAVDEVKLQIAMTRGSGKLAGTTRAN